MQRTTGQSRTTRTAGVAADWQSLRPAVPVVTNGVMTAGGLTIPVPPSPARSFGLLFGFGSTPAVTTANAIYLTGVRTTWVPGGSGALSAADPDGSVSPAAPLDESLVDVFNALAGS